MKRGGTHFDDDARDAMFGATAQAPAKTSVSTIAVTPRPSVLEIRFSNVLGGWVVETDDDSTSVFKDEDAAKAWISKNCR